MLVSKKRIMISVLSVVLVSLIALMAVAPALASAATGTKDRLLSSSKVKPVEPIVPIVPEPPKGTLYVAKIGYEVLPWMSVTHRNIAIHVVIMDQTDVGIADVVVTGKLDIPSSELDRLLAKTDRNGEAVFQILIPRDSEATFCVTDALKEGYAYDPKGGEEACIKILAR